MRLWDINSGATGDVLTISGSEEEVVHVSFMKHSDVEYLICGCKDGFCSVYRVVPVRTQGKAGFPVPIQCLSSLKRFLL